MCSPSVNTKHHFQMENNQQFPTPEKGISSQTSLFTFSTFQGDLYHPEWMESEATESPNLFGSCLDVFLGCRLCNWLLDKSVRVTRSVDQPAAKLQIANLKTSRLHNPPYLDMEVLIPQNLFCAIAAYCTKPFLFILWVCLELQIFHLKC